MQRVLGILPLVHFARERGLDVGRLLRKARIAPAALEDPYARLAFASELALVQELLEKTGDAALGLDVGARYHLALFGLLGAAASAAPTLREVIRVFLEHLDLTFTPFAVAFDESGGEARIVFVDDVELGPLRRFYLDRDLAFVLETARTLWPDTHGSFARRVDFDYPEPREAARYRLRAPCPVVFGAELAAAVMDLSTDRPRAHSSALGLRVLEHELRAAFGAAATRDDLVGSVRRAIAIAVVTRASRPDICSVAATLGVPERTLRRRLAEQETSFRALEDEVLARLARRALEAGASVAATAERLGYAEAASFVRAHRRWTGTTPRRRARTAQRRRARRH